MDHLEALAQTFDHTSKVVSGVSDDQLANPTPCREWDVRTLLTHMTGVVANMGRGAGGEALLPDVREYPLRADRSAQFSAEADKALAAWTARGVEGDVNIGAGPMPVMVGMSINLLDTATHSWDIARATDQQADLPDDLAAFVLEAARGVVNDQIRTPERFGAVVTVPPDASPTAQLVAFLGRQP